MNSAAAFRSIKTFFIELNLFESINSRSNANHLRTAIIATRIYIVLMSIAIFTLVFFTAFETKTYLVTVQNPSEDTFKSLYAEHSAVLQCPCNNVEIPYKTFINISYVLHPICSSVFVSNGWINLLFRYDMGYYYPFDFRSTGDDQFQLLASLCSFANRIIQDATDDFLSSTFLSPQALSLESLVTQSDANSYFLETSTAYTYRRLLNVVHDTTVMNGLQPAMQTSKVNLIHIYPNDSIDTNPLETIWVGAGDGEGDCFCGITVNCYTSVGFFDLYAKETARIFNLTMNPMVTVTGFVIGCYALDGLLHSTLECFYNLTCLTTLLTYFPTSDMTNLNILDINQTHYSSGTTIEILANDLFIEQWSTDVLFSAYYSTCAPLLCTYKFTRYSSLLEILTTLLSVYGGLTVVLRICVLRTVHYWRNRKQDHQIELNAVIPISERLQNAQRHLKTQLIELNLFKTNITRTDPHEQKTEIISTRIYFLVLVFVLSIIMVYLLFSLRVYTVTIENPSRLIFESLYQKYTTTLQCPCSSIANQYVLFTSLSPVFHPVCSSLYISDEWIVSISGLNIVGSFFSAIDFRTAGPTFFNTLATLCSLTNITIADAWYIFGQGVLITDYTLIQSEFEAQTKSTIEQFQNDTLSEFQRIISLVELHTKTMYATGYENIVLTTNELSNTTTPIDFGLIAAGSTTCSCDLDAQCNDVMSFYTYTDNTIYAPFYLNFTLPDIKVGCFVLSSVLQSSIGCFFNQTCLDMVQDEVKSERSINISILNKNSTRFAPDTLIGTILDDMMIETWNEKMNYDKYFEQCAPEQCTYTYTASQNFFTIITTIFGLFGGLSVVLRIVVPLIVRWIRNQIRSRRDPMLVTVQSSTINRLNNVWRTLKTKLLQFNMFKSELSWDDDRRHRREILTTRIYLLLLILSVIILVIYTFIDTQTQIVKVLNPSQQQFNELQLHPRSSATLDCPCQNIIVPYQSYMSIKPHFHQLCSSDFVSTNSTWIDLIYSPTAGTQYLYNDYRLFVVSQFQLLSSLCTLANETVTETIVEFYRNNMINERVQSREAIELQANTTLNQFCLSTPRTFVLTLDFIRSMAQGNGIVSSILSNWHFLSSDTKVLWDKLWAVPRSYGNDNCSCGTSAMCTSEASYDGFIVPGFRVGCYPLEALLQSTLECLYNISCIDQLKSMYNTTNLTFNPLDASQSSPNITVQSLVDTLLIERWETNVAYDQYYTACAPLSCTYTFNGQISLLYTMTTIISLYGGLSVILKLFTPALVKLGYHMVSYRYRRVEPIVISIKAPN